MAKLKIFVSSTCYDLSVVRSRLRVFLQSMGYDPIMSDYSDVLYSPEEHTHVSCLKEIENCDMTIVIIGSRFGGTIVPEAMTVTDVRHVISAERSRKHKDIDPKHISITQMEVISSLDREIPIFVFVDKKIIADHHLYEVNKNNPDIDINKIFYPNIEKQSHAKYIFGFINFIRGLKVNNSYFEFDTVEDIESTLLSQWSALFQRMLNDRLIQKQRDKQMKSIDTKLDEIKTALLSSIVEEKRAIAKYTIQFGNFVNLLTKKFEIYEFDDIPPQKDTDKFLKALGYEYVIKASPAFSAPIYVFVKTDFDCEMFEYVIVNAIQISQINEEIQQFNSLENSTKRDVFHSWLSVNDQESSHTHHSVYLDDFSQIRQSGRDKIDILLEFLIADLEERNIPSIVEGAISVYHINEISNLIKPAFTAEDIPF